MFADIITLVDSETGNQNYDLTYRSGYNSVRRHTTAASNVAYKLEVKNTIDLNAPDKPNRHLVSLSKLYEDTVTGEFKQATVHFVITRHKDIPDASLTDMCVQLGGFLGDETEMANLLKGYS